MPNESLPATSTAPKLKFTPRQNRIITSALSLSALAVLFIIIATIVSHAFKFVSTYSSVLLPPIVAIICAKVIQPAYNKLRKFFWGALSNRVFNLENHKFFVDDDTDSPKEKLARGISNTLAMIILFSAFFIPIILFIYFFGQLLFTQILALINSIPSITAWVTEVVHKNSPIIVEFIDKYNLRETIASLNPANAFDVNAISSSLGSSARSIFGYTSSAIGSLLGWIALPIYTAIYLASRPLEGRDFSKVLVFSSEKTRNNVKFLIDEFIRLVVSFFRGQVMVALIQGVLFAFGFHFIADLDYGMIIGFLLGFSNIVPYLGNILGIPMISLFAVFGPGGSTGKLGILACIFIAVQSIDSYFITPRVMGNRTGLNSFVIIFSLFFWGAVIGGALGMVLAIPLSAFVVVLWKLLVREYFTPTTNS